MNNEYFYEDLTYDSMTQLMQEGEDRQLDSGEFEQQSGDQGGPCAEEEAFGVGDHELGTEGEEDIATSCCCPEVDRGVSFLDAC